MKLRERRYIPVAFILLLICPALLNASDDPVKIKLTMDEVVEKALQTNNQVRSSRYAMDKARWDKRNAWTLLLPTMSFNTRIMRIDDQTFAERDFRRYLPPELANEIPQTVFRQSWFTSFDVSMPLFNSSILNGIAIANTNMRMAENLNSSTRENIIYLAISDYLNVLKAKDVLELQKKHLELSRLNFEKAERLYKAGRYSNVEMLQWKVEYQQQKGIVVNYESDLRSRIISLKRTINMDESGELIVEGDISDRLDDEAARFVTMSEQDIIGMIQLDDEALIHANAALAAAQANEEISKRMYLNDYYSYLPSVSASYSYGWRENDTYQLDDYSPKTIMVNLSMPIFSSFQRLTSIKSSYYEYRRSQEQFQDQIHNTRFVLTQAVNRIINLKTQREITRTTVEFNKNNFEVIKQQRESGLVSNLDYIDSQLKLQNAEINEVSTGYDYILAVVELNYLLSKLDALF
ncbi:MAG: TolC family protein [candidate division KSB1 bacterium]|jgi:outer membrane protein|nr:TolC family protein [candidate division KSB1 bacterium]